MSKFAVMESETASQQIYSPSAILNLFKNSVNISQSKRMIQLRGVFLQGRSSAYNGYYYVEFFGVDENNKFAGP